VAFVAVSLLAVVAIGLLTAAAVAVVRRVELPERVVRALGWLALGVAAAMALVFAGVVTWWAAEAAHAPVVLANGIGAGFTSGTAPPTLVAAGVLMVLGLVLATAGSLRVARALRNRPAT
jgi:hypothetical protein